MQNAVSSDTDADGSSPRTGIVLTRGRTPLDPLRQRAQAASAEEPPLALLPNPKPTAIAEGGVGHSPTTQLAASSSPLRHGDREFGLLTPHEPVPATSRTAGPLMNRPMHPSRNAALNGADNPVFARNEARRALAKKLIQEMGAGIAEALLDPDVTDIERNTDGRTWVSNARSGRRELTGDDAVDDWGALNLIGTVAALADDGRRDEITRDSPHLETPIPEIYPGMPGAGCRFTATIPPQSKRPMFSIRRPAGFVRSLTDYLDDNLLTMSQVVFLRTAVAKRENFAIVGETGSGKTSFANALLKEMSEMAGIDERFAIIEDVPELVCTAPRYYNHFTVPHLNIHLAQCVEAALRYTPTRICIGEIRRKGAYEVLDAWLTGHKGGLITLHAGTAVECLERMRGMATRDGQIPPRKDIVIGINVIVVVTKRPKEPRKISIFRVLEPTDTEFIVAGVS
jgi:Flp pilus assembly CpaF family ATPase